MGQPTHLFLKPKNPEACIRDPRSRMKIPAYGGKVANSPYWRARHRDGDCVETTSEDIAKGKSAAAKKVADAAKAAAASESLNPKPADSAKKGR